MRQKKLIIGLLVMLALVVSSFTYAYWNTVVAPADDVAAGTVTIGQGNTITTTVVVGNVNDTSALVPTAYAATAGVEDTVALSFSVDWSDVAGAADGTNGTLAVTIDSYTLDTLTEAQIDAMFTITVTSGTGAIVAGTAQPVIVTVVFFAEPSTETIYNQVALDTLTFNLTFTVTI